MFFGGGIVFDSGCIYVYFGYNYLVVFDVQSGSEIWCSEIIVLFYGVLMVVDGWIFVVLDDNEMLLIDVFNGNVNWIYQGIIEFVCLIILFSLVVFGDIVVVLFVFGEIVVLCVQNGNFLWFDSLSGLGMMMVMFEINDVVGSLIIVDNMVYVMSYLGMMVVILLCLGECLWELLAGGLYVLWVVGDYFYVVMIEVQVVCINCQFGQVYWIIQFQQFENMCKCEDCIVWLGLVLVGGCVFVIFSYGEVVLLNVYDGLEMCEYQLCDNVFVVFVIVNEMIYIVIDEVWVIVL